jgi:cell division transport system ATP-binding protein
LLADEPTASLDEVQAKRVLRLFKEISDGGTAVLIATHDRSLARGSGARMVRLSNGRLVSDRRSRGRLWVVP